MNLEKLRSDTRFLVFGNSSDTSYANTDLDRNINRWYNTCIAWILEANGDWQVNGEKAYADIVAGQREYILPLDILKLNEVYIKADGGEYAKAKQRDPRSVNQYPDSNYNPQPPEFDLFDNSLFIYLPNEIQNVSEGIMVFYQSELTELAQTSDSPNIAEPFNRMLSLGAAKDFCLANEMFNKASVLENQVLQARQDLLSHYSKRSLTKSVRLMPAETNYY